jgi:hypothetical protein
MAVLYIMLGTSLCIAVSRVLGMIVQYRRRLKSLTGLDGGPSG